jgi:hypothetical protein
LSSRGPSSSTAAASASLRSAGSTTAQWSRAGPRLRWLRRRQRRSSPIARASNRARLSRRLLQRLRRVRLSHSARARTESRTMARSRPLPWRLHLPLRPSRRRRSRPRRWCRPRLTTASEGPCPGRTVPGRSRPPVSPGRRPFPTGMWGRRTGRASTTDPTDQGATSAIFSPPGTHVL